MSLTSYWLLNWLESHGVYSPEDVSRVHFGPTELGEMRETAKLWWDNPPEIPDAGRKLCAGVGFDLGNYSPCFNADCRSYQVEHLFRHTWHYFDSIILPDAAGQILLFEDWDVESGGSGARLRAHMQTTLHLQQVGAESIIDFMPRTPPSYTWQDDALTTDPGIIRAARRLARTLAKQASFERKQLGEDEVAFLIRHALVAEGVGIRGLESGLIDAAPEHLRNRDLAEAFINWRGSIVYSDYVQSREIGAPLGVSEPLFPHIFGSLHQDGVAAEVALSLELPVLTGIPLADLLRLRQDESESFYRFQRALSTAIKEKAAIGEQIDGGRIAKQIEDDLIRPELNALRHRLRIAQRTLSRKSWVGLALGGLTTTCGLLAGTPPTLATTAGVGALVAFTGAAATKYLDDKSGLELSDLYFLWKAHEHAT